MTVINSYNLIGRCIPFFLSNMNELSDQYYLYQVYSPKLNTNLEPYVSITKISEKTTRPEALIGKDTDILAACIGSRKVNKENGVECLNDLLKRENPTINLPDNDTDFPYITLTGPNLVKSMIVNLRHANRVKNYRLWSGRLVDVLYTPTEYMVLKVCEDKTNVWFEPVGLYKITDMNMQNPIDIEPKALHFDRTKWEKSIGQNKVIAEMLYSIKLMDWSSFNRKSRLVGKKEND